MKFQLFSTAGSFLRTLTTRRNVSAARLALASAGNESGTVPVQRRRGSVLIVVIGLLGILLLLGFTFFTFAQQEDNSAIYFSDGLKQQNSLVFTQLLADWGLSQLIVGPHNSQRQSALHGKRHAMVTSEFGIDFAPYSGEGIPLVSGAGGQPFVDQNNTGSATGSGDQTLLDFNYSAAAGPGGVAPTVPTVPSPDVDATYPDINNVFLSYTGYTMDGMGNAYRVVIPSFHRPQLLRDSSGPIPNWHSVPATKTRVLRPHPNHVIAGTNIPRFLSTSSTNALGLTVPPFPFSVDTNNNGIFGEQGIWSSNSNLPANNLVYATNIDFDADADGDGIYEAVYLDLGFPAQDVPDGRKYIPLFAFTVVCADSLINLNAVGNLAGIRSLSGPLGNNVPASKSDQGLSTAEISPWHALDADPNTVADIPASQVGSAMYPYNQFFGYDPTSRSWPYSRIEMANMEMLFLNVGRPDLTASGLQGYFSGRWGELERLQNAWQQILAGNGNLSSFPYPGITGVDDDSTRFTGEISYSQDFFNGTNYIGIPPFIHPLDFSGSGTFLNFNGATGGDPYGRRPALGGLGTVNDPNRWLHYSGYRQRLWVTLFGPDGRPGTAGVDDDGNGTIDIYSDGTYDISELGYGDDLVSYGSDGLPGVAGYDDDNNGTVDDRSELGTPGSDDWSQMGMTIVDALVDDPMETISDPQNEQSSDEIFDPEEMEGLHLSNADQTASTTKSRLQNLMPFNFKSNSRAADIRKRFTTMSFDRVNYGLPLARTAGSALGLRTWEFNADADANGDPEFPPAFNSNGSGTSEPFRRPLRKLLELELGNTTNRKYQFRLNLHKFLASNDPYDNGTVTYPNVTPYYRDLTPHPADPGAAAIGTSATSIPGATPPQPMGVQDQEFWARRDRQQMARDIYVLLYALCGGSDALNYTVSNVQNASGNRPLYQDWQMREMAQFAVNLVDAQDRDHVITAFEYDKDLSDGWSVDDITSTLDGDTYYTDPNDGVGATTDNVNYSSKYTEDGALRGVVYGVESQQLTFSEVLPVVFKQVYTGDNSSMPLKDNLASEFDDRNVGSQNSSPYGRYFNYVELRNASSSPVNVNNLNWRIAVSYTDQTLGQVTNYLQLNDQVTGSIGAGGLYTIGGTDTANIDPLTTQQRPSFVRIDPAFDPNVGTAASPYPIIIPRSGTLSLDVTTVGATNYTLVNSSGTALNNLQWLTNANPMQPVTYKLYRRQHLTRTAPTAGNSAQQADNPWIEVDATTINAIPIVDLKDPNNNTATYTTYLPTQLSNIQSRERPQPLDALSETPNNQAIYANSLGQLNVATTNLGGAFTVWQPHFDRDFASLIELLSIPLYGPWDVTRNLAVNGRIVSEQPNDFAINVDPMTSQPYVASATSSSPLRTAASKFLRPQHLGNFNNQQVNGTTVDVRYDNRWHRLLEFLGVTNRSTLNPQFAMQIDALSPVPRVSGKINLNTVRDWQVLAGLIDDQSVINLFPSSPYPGNPSLTNLTDNLEPGPVGSGTALRDWWFQFLISRDQLDPITGLPLPGLPGSRPFRSLAYMADGNRSIEHTLLRSLPLDRAEDTNDNGIRDGGEDLNSNGLLDNAIGGTADAGPGGRRRLFEVGNVSDHFTNNVDYYTRHRVLSKIAGNTTTRSHVFLVWLQVDFFEAVQNGTDANGHPQYQIGGKISLPGLNGHRIFSVVDRSIAEEAYNQQYGFNFRSFIKYQRIIQ